jgi:excisionase family DNA binding protein
MSSKVFQAEVPARLMPIKPAAAYLGTTVWQMRTLVWEKKLPHLRIGKRILFDKADLDSYVDSVKVA